MKNVLLTIGVLAALGLGAIGLTSPAPRDNSSDFTPIKAVSGPAFSGRWISVGGVRTEEIKIPLLTASTTVCNIAGPAATSTIESFFVDVATGTTSEAHIQLASSATPDATTTVISSAYLPANVGNQIAATSTITHTVLAANSYLVVKASPTVGTASAGTVSMTGSCGASFKVIDY